MFDSDVIQLLDGLDSAELLSFMRNHDVSVGGDLEAIACDYNVTIYVDRHGHHYASAHFLIGLEDASTRRFSVSAKSGFDPFEAVENLSRQIRHEIRRIR